MRRRLRLRWRDVGTIIKAEYLAANIRVLRIDGEDEADMISTLALRYDVTIHCHENIYPTI